MYKLLLCWRYLRTRWIALASIVSVTLGVATLIVVNSVMDGFTEEMQNRIHGILSDLVVDSHSNGGIADPEWFEERIRFQLGDRLEGLTTVVTVPAMLNFTFNGSTHTQQINLIGIDQKTYAKVSDFSQYLLHPENRKSIDFQLKENGYAPGREQFPDSGWEYRRDLARIRKQIDAETQRNRMLRGQISQIETGSLSLTNAMQTSAVGVGEIDDATSAETADGLNERPADGKIKVSLSDSPLPEAIDSQETQSRELNTSGDANIADELTSTQPLKDSDSLSQGPSYISASTRAAASHVFDAEHNTYDGIVLGISIGSMRYRNPEGNVKDLYFIRPGDDVSIALPGAGNPPRAIDQAFTVVDFYESRMSEYDSSFAFVPIERLQTIRGMIDPSTGKRAVSSIQLKLRRGTDLAKARDELRAIFNPEQTMVHVESWRDSQGPLLAAVQMETTILNILLFMIIAVAGFGILATFFMIVVEKTRDIGVLKSLGAPGYGIASIFLTYGLLLGTVGSGVGAIIGLLFVWKINSIASVIEWLTGREVFDPTIYYFSVIPTVVHAGTIIWVVLGSIAIAVLASVLPSIRAARMHPVQALRYE